MKHLVTFSDLDRFLGCPGYGTIPKIRSSSVEARKGTAKHQKLYDGTIDPRFKEELEAMPEDGPYPYEEREVVYSIDMKDGSVHKWEDLEDRDYDKIPENHIPGTIDLVYTPPMICPVIEIRDYKTGYSKQPRPQEANQLFAAAYCVHRCSLENYPVNVAFRVLKEDKWEDLETLTLTKEALDTWFKNLQDTWKKTCQLGTAKQLGEPEDIRNFVWEYDRCKNCPSWDFCPTARKKIETFGSYEEAVLINKKAREVIRCVEENAKDCPKEFKDKLLYEKEIGTYYIDDEKLNTFLILSGLPSLSGTPTKKKIKEHIHEYCTEGDGVPESVTKECLDAVCVKVIKGKLVVEDKNE